MAQVNTCNNSPKLPLGLWGGGSSVWEWDWWVKLIHSLRDLPCGGQGVGRRMGVCVRCGVGHVRMCGGGLPGFWVQGASWG